MPPSGPVSTTPVTRIASAVMPDTWMVGIPAGMRCVAMSRIEQKKTEASTSRLKALKPSKPGRMMRSTPAKPAAIALQRRQPTFSPKNSTDPKVTTSGNVWKIDTTLFSGMYCSASM